MMFAPIPAAHGNVSAGALRARGVTSLKRSSLCLNPTVAEAGLAGFEVVQRSTLLAPRHALAVIEAAQQGAQCRAPPPTR